MQAIQMDHDINNASLLEGTDTEAETVDRLIDYLRLGNEYMIRAVQHGHAYAKSIRPSLAEISANIAMWFAYDDLYKAKRYSVRSIKEIELESEQCQEAALFLAKNERYLAACEFCRYRREALELLAQDGDAAAQGELGSLFIRGDYLGRDCKTGHKWLKIAAENGDVPAMIEHAYCLLGFCEGTKNVPLALDWLEKAAETGDVDAECALAHVLARGVGSQKISYDFKRAMLLYDDLCKQEDYDAMFDLAEIYRIGYNTKADRKKAEQLYRRAAELGSKRSRLALSEHFGYKYTTRLLSEWFQESLENKVVFDPPCPHCGSGLYATWRTFLGQTYWQCPACKGKFLESDHLGRIKI
jgi:TPR repeat protein